MARDMIFFIKVVFIFFTGVSSVQAFDPGSFVKDIFGARAGAKSVDLSEGKDLKPFQKEGLCPKFYPWGAPVVKDKEVSGRSLYLCRTMYAVQYDPMTKTPLWSSEVLQKKNFEGNYYTSGDLKFIPDPDLPSRMQIKITDFVSPNYNFGQMASSGNMIFNEEDIEEEKWLTTNKKAMEESYYYSNTVPMVGVNLNQGIWSELDLRIRGWIAERNELYVTTGPLYLDGKTRELLGESKVAVPTHFFKIITHPLKYGSVAFLIPNKEIVTASTKKIVNPKDAYYCNGGPCSLDNFLIPIKDLERLSGIEFYPKLAPHYSVQVKNDINEILKRRQKKKDSKF